MCTCEIYRVNESNFSDFHTLMPNRTPCHTSDTEFIIPISQLVFIMSTEHLTRFVRTANSLTLLLVSVESFTVVIFAEPSTSSVMPARYFTVLIISVGQLTVPTKFGNFIFSSLI